MEAVAPVTTTHTVAADDSIFAPRCITDFDLLKLEDSPKIHEDYLQAENRMIFIGHVKVSHEQLGKYYSQFNFT
jgi:hypothetical protein